MRRLRTFLTSLVVLGMLGLGGMTPTTLAASDDLPPLADVPLFRANERRTTIQPGPGPVSEPQVAWTVELDSSTRSFPILVGGLLIVGTQSGDLVALDARSGEERWRATGTGAFASAPAADAGLVVAADSASIRAFDAATGVQRWQRDVMTEDARIEITDGVVYVGTIDGAVKGLDLQTGADRWSWQGDRGLNVRVDIVDGGIVYANPNDGRLLAIDLADGSERWTFRSPASVLGYTIGDDTLFVFVPDDEVAAIDVATGRVRWGFPLPSQTGGMAFKDGILYVASQEEGIWSLADDGDGYTIVWHNETPNRFTPALVGDALYFVDQDDSLVAVETRDGALRWEATVPADASDVSGALGPIVSGGMAFTVD